MIKDIKKYKGIYKLSEYKGDEISQEDIRKVIDFIIDCDLSHDNLYVDTSPVFDDIIYYFDGVFLNTIKYPYLDKDKKYAPFFDIRKYRKDENGKFVKKENIDEDDDISYYDYYKKSFLDVYGRYMRNYEDGHVIFSEDIDKRFHPMIYGIFYNKMNRQQRYNSFINFYKYYDFAKQFFTVKELKDIASTVPKYIIEKRASYDIVQDNFVTVYRGEESLSSKGDKAISWTTDLEVAKFFASRFTQKGRVLSGKVNIKDIIVIFDKEFYYDEDDKDIEDPEKEVLVKPNSVKDIKIIK